MNERVWWIPRIVAQRAGFHTGEKPVVWRSVYVGPCSNVFGWIWRVAGWPTEAC